MKTTFEETRFARQYAYLETKENKALRLKKISELELRMAELERKEDEASGLDLYGIHLAQDSLAEKINELKEVANYEG